MKTVKTQGSDGTVRHVRMLGLCVVASLGLGLITAAAASAAKPEFGKCQRLPTNVPIGKYSDPACTVSASKRSGRYEWAPARDKEGVGTQFGLGGGTRGSTTPFVLETTGGTKLECADQAAGVDGRTSLVAGQELGEGSEGTPGTPGEAAGYFNFTECHESSEGTEEGKPCFAQDSPSFEGGEITNGGIEPFGYGKLVYLSGKGTESPTVGFAYAPYQEGTPFFDVVCEGHLGTVVVGGTTKHGHDMVLGEIGPVDEMTTTHTLTFSESGGVPSPLTTESGKEEYLQSSVATHYEESGWSVTITLEGEEEGEIKAVK